MIYMLEDDDSIRKLVVYTLTSQGMEAKGFDRPSLFWKALDQQVPDLLLLDIMLPEEDGLQVLKKLRESPAARKLPVLLLTAKSAEYDKVIGLDAGADDYIAKPFGMMELMARIRTALRKHAKAAAAPAEENAYTVQNVRLEKDARRVLVNGTEVKLTRKEFDLLECLMEHRGKVMDRSSLLEQVWGYDFAGETNSVDVVVRFLRSKIDEPYGLTLIETVRGVGYVIR